MTSFEHKNNKIFRSKDKDSNKSTTSFLDYLTSNQPPLESQLVHKRTQTDPLPEPPRPKASPSSASLRSGKSGRGGPQINSDEIKQHVTKECNNAAGQIAERIPPIENTLRMVFLSSTVDTGRMIRTEIILKTYLKATN